MRVYDESVRYVEFIYRYHAIKERVAILSAGHIKHRRTLPEPNGPLTQKAATAILHMLVLCPGNAYASLGFITLMLYPTERNYINMNQSEVLMAISVHTMKKEVHKTAQQI